MLKPQTLWPEGKARLLKGIANSALQPSEERLVLTIQIASQSSLVSPFANTNPSTSAPLGLVEKWNALLWSRKVSRMMLSRSSGFRLASRAICEASTRCGSES